MYEEVLRVESQGWKNVGDYRTFLFELKAQTGFHGHPWDKLICERGQSYHKDNSLSMGGISLSPI
ncbi:hypothetical protein Premu_0619 [Hallella multisaccharivorax DSM 17128]|uniref:Uncharacterized protein n=1 Tax=Hallella multisaccharivorax DSM 17128 TaxID=688246 RepID=F8N5T3_9BACT|nr:hypothetical protein Premu_0619 [Hallella multisaccharivorax DSM 17128]